MTADVILRHLAPYLIVWVGTVLMWRLGGRRQEAAAVAIIAVAFLADEILTLWLRIKLPLREFGPMCWLPGVLMNAALVAMVVHLCDPKGPWWPMLLCFLLIAGIVWFAAMGLIWMPHRHEPYNQKLFGIYDTYIRMKNLLARLELYCVGWPTIRCGVVAARRWYLRHGWVPRLGGAGLH